MYRDLQCCALTVRLQACNPQLGSTVTMEEVTSANSGVTMDFYPRRKPSKDKGGPLPIEQVQAAMEAYVPPEGYEAVTVFAKVGG